MIGLFLGILLVVVASPAWAQDDDDAEFGVLDGERLSNQLAGPKAKADDFRGKVTLVVYWDGDYNTARGWMPEVKKIQAEYYETGKFMVVAVQTGKEESAADLKDFASGFVLNFPVYQRIGLDDYDVKRPEGVDGPLMVLLDTKGKVVATYNSWQLFDAEGEVLLTGSKGTFAGKTITVLESTIEETIEASSEPSPLLEGVELDEFEGTEDQFQPGVSISRAFGQLERTARKDDDRGTEAKAMIAAINTWITTQTEELEALREENPAEALVKAEMLYTTIKGLDGDKEIWNIGEALRKNKNTADLVTLKELVAEANDLAFTEGNSSKFEKKVALIRRGVKIYCKRKDLEFADKQEAQDMLDNVRMPIESEEEEDD